MLDAGYDGYRTDNLAVVLNKDVPVKAEGTSTGKTFSDHVFDTREKSRSVFAGVPSAGGEYSSSPLNLGQIGFWQKNKTALQQAIPSVRMQYGRLFVHKDDLQTLKAALDAIPNNPLV